MVWPVARPDSSSGTVARIAANIAKVPEYCSVITRPKSSDVCSRSQLFTYFIKHRSRQGKRSFGDDDGRAPNRLRRSDCNRLFGIPANLDQSTTNNGVKNVKHLFAGSKNHRCTRPRTSICRSSSSHPQTLMDWNGGRSRAG
jgi:hypothetical protein